MDYNKNRHTFEREIGSILIKNRKSTSKLIREKIENCFYNWQELMPEYVAGRNTENIKETKDLKALVEILRSRRISYNGGVIKLESIESISKDKTDGTIIVSLNSGKEVTFVPEMDYLLKIF